MADCGKEQVIRGKKITSPRFASLITPLRKRRGAGVRFNRIVAVQECDATNA